MAIRAALAGFAGLLVQAISLLASTEDGLGVIEPPRHQLSPSKAAGVGAAETAVSITIMEVIDNLFVALLAGAMNAGLADPLLWGSIAGGFVAAFPFAFLANRIMLKRGKGCAAMHRHSD